MLIAPSAKSSAPLCDPIQHTVRPIVTGASVLGVTYQDGVLLAADTMASYGSMLRFSNVRRIDTLGKFTLIGASGEYSDFQEIMQTLKEQELREWTTSVSGSTSDPKETASYLTLIMYNKRCKMNPLWNSLAIAGYKNNSKFLGYVDMYGTHFTENFVATGFGSYMALPILRNEFKENMTETEARDLLTRCLEILAVRHCQAHNKVTFAKASAEGVTVEPPVTIQGKWHHQDFLKRTMDTELAAASW
eukprot:Lankesteria_metandrocarpae@DN4323_c0_g1_i1.p2